MAPATMRSTFAVAAVLFVVALKLASLQAQAADGRQSGTTLWDVDALQRTKEGFQEGSLPSWKGSDPCGEKWEGVTCAKAATPFADGALLYVEKLDLSGMQLSGVLSHSIGTMANLRVLNLANNQLSGSIPESIRMLSNLTVLDLSNNKFSGFIPVQLGLLRNLTTMSLAFNQLKGIVPKEFAGLVSLKSLFLNSNNLSGRIPRGFAHDHQLEEINLDNNHLTRGLPYQLASLKNLKRLILSRNLLHGPFPLAWSSMTTLQYLQLDYNNLNGSLPSFLGNFSNLVVLQLRSNQFSGSVPAALGSLPRLEVLSLQQNNLTGTVDISLKRFASSFTGNQVCIDLGDGFCHSPPDPAEEARVLANLTRAPCAIAQVQMCRCDDGSAGQQACVDGQGYAACSCRQQYFDLRQEDTLSLGWILFLSLLSASAATAIIGVVVIFCCRGRQAGFGRKKNAKWDFAGTRAYHDLSSFRAQAFDPDDAYSAVVRSPADGSADNSASLGQSGGGAVDPQSNSAVAFALKFGKAMNITQSLNLRQFSFDELQMATSNFSLNNVIAVDYELRTFSGVLPNESYLAVKELPPTPPTESPSVFASVLEAISSISGSNQSLVPVIGFCSDAAGGRRFLVYELIPNGTMHMHLHENDDDVASLDWNRRVDIALGVAQGLQQLHEMTPQMLHENLTSSTVYLDDALAPKLSDYSLAALTQGPKSAVLSNTAVAAGTVAPELAWSPKFSSATDVYAFGILLLELITGRQAVDPMRPPNEQSLVRWAKPKLVDRAQVEGIVDPKLKGEYSKTALLQLAALSSACVHADPESRPTMAVAVDTLLKLQLIQSS